MKKLLFLLSISILGLFACNKDQEIVKQPAKNVKEALARISAVSTWKVNQITLDGVLKFDDGKSLDPDYDGIAEWIKFNTSNQTVEVKYFDGDEISTFNYVIDEVNQTFSVVDSSNGDEEEVYTIKAGSVYDDKFELDATYDNRVEVIKLVPKF